MTLQLALKLVPSVVVAVMVAFPQLLAVTRPSLLTVATLVLLELQVTFAFVTLLGNTVAVSCRVSPLFMVADVLFSVIPVASWLTVILQFALRFEPSVVVAVMVAFPLLLAVTRPLLLTVATLVLLELQATAELLALPGDTVAVN